MRMVTIVVLCFIVAGLWCEYRSQVEGVNYYFHLMVEAQDEEMLAQSQLRTAKAQNELCAELMKFKQGE